MVPTSTWLDDIVVVNESGDMRVPGDVGLHRSHGDACAALEPWWVHEDRGFALTASGHRLILAAETDGPVRIVGCEELPEGPALVLSWLTSLAETMIQARRRVAAEGRVVLSQAEIAGELPATIEGLIAYIGLPWVAPRDRFTPGCLILLAINALLLILVLGNLL